MLDADNSVLQSTLQIKTKERCFLFLNAVRTTMTMKTVAAFLTFLALLPTGMAHAFGEERIIVPAIGNEAIALHLMVS